MSQNMSPAHRPALPAGQQDLGGLTRDLLALSRSRTKPMPAGISQSLLDTYIDLNRFQPKADLARPFDPLSCLRLAYLPWRQIGETTLIAVADIADLPAIQATIPKEIGKYTFVQADRTTIRHYVTHIMRDGLRDATRDRCPAHLSCRTWAGTRRLTLPIFGLALATAIWLAPYAMLTAALIWVMLANVSTMILRGTALIESFRRRPAPSNIVPLRNDHALPKISILVPLLREDVVVRHLISALSKTTYPKHLLDIKLVIEADDFATELALTQIDLPDWISVLAVPEDDLRTKPRAMNYALEFCDGDIMGIYDAEDRPDPDQLMKVAQALHFGPPDLACVQGYLDFYNSRQNWLSRCFTIEYATWFRVLLRGAQRLGVPLPLGGTTVFFRRNLLEKVGAWDAHNVTEDADLGMRLARFGYRTEMVATTTMEEANCHARAWIMQRSRWLKGYAVTWATHMRRPMALYRDLGFAGFWGFQVLFLGALTAYLATPVFWLLWTGALGFDLPIWQAIAWPVWTGFFASMLIGQLIMISVALRAVWARPRRHLIPWVFTLGLYWPLGALAAYKAIFEVFYKPFYWHKTHHGL
ncbi:glycosyltransferase family 2 protein [Halovulum sp. GXIMD14793]